jgi:hypothetical protein
MLARIRAVDGKKSGNCQIRLSNSSNVIRVKYLEEWYETWKTHTLQHKLNNSKGNCIATENKSLCQTTMTKLRAENMQAQSASYQAMSGEKKFSGDTALYLESLQRRGRRNNSKTGNWKKIY